MASGKLAQGQKKTISQAFCTLGVRRAEEVPSRLGHPVPSICGGRVRLVVLKTARVTVLVIGRASDCGDPLKETSHCRRNSATFAYVQIEFYDCFYGRPTAHRAIALFSVIHERTPSPPPFPIKRRASPSGHGGRAPSGNRGKEFANVFYFFQPIDERRNTLRNIAVERFAAVSCLLVKIGKVLAFRLGRCTDA